MTRFAIGIGLFVLGGLLALPLLVPDSLVLQYAQQLAEQQNARLNWENIRWRILPRPSVVIQNLELENTEHVRAQTLQAQFRWRDVLQGQGAPHLIRFKRLVFETGHTPPRQVVIRNAEILIQQRNDYLSIVLDSQDFYAGTLHGEADILIRNESLDSFTINYALTNSQLRPLFADLRLPRMEGRLALQGNLRGPSWQAIALASLAGDGEIAITELGFAQPELTQLFGARNAIGMLSGGYNIAAGKFQAPDLNGNIGSEAFNLQLEYTLADEQIRVRLEQLARGNVLNIGGSLDNPRLSFELNPELEDHLRGLIRQLLIR